MSQSRTGRWLYWLRSCLSPRINLHRPSKEGKKFGQVGAPRTRSVLRVETTPIWSASWVGPERAGHLSFLRSPVLGLLTPKKVFSLLTQRARWGVGEDGGKSFPFLTRCGETRVTFRLLRKEGVSGARRLLTPTETKKSNVSVNLRNSETWDPFVICWVENRSLLVHVRTHTHTQSPVPHIFLT